jgi:hypothetical protein
MYITPAMFVWGFWIVGIVGAVLILGMFILSAQQALPGDALSWRAVKVVSAGAGIIGFLLLLLNFEQVVRNSMVTGAKEYELNSFLEVKLVTMEGLLFACAGPKETIEAQRSCSDFRALDQNVSLHRFWTGKPLGKLDVSNKSGEAARVTQQVNNAFEQIDHSRQVFGDPGTFSFGSRLLISLISLVFVLVGLGGGLGEALFQYRQEKLKAGCA